MYTRIASALVAGYALVTVALPAHAADLNGRPIIGTPAYSAGCALTQAWEDGSAIAYCPEDGATYVYDPDGNNPPASVGYDGPRWDAGWYEQSDYDAMRDAQLGN